MSNATNPSELHPGQFMGVRSAISRWRAFVGGSPLRKMGHAALVAAATSLAARGMGFIKEVLVAASFGLSGALDVYLVAFVLIGFPLSILLNAVQTALIAALAGCGYSSGEADRLYAGTALLTLACLAVLLPMWLLLLPDALPWLASGFSIEKRQVLQTVLVWLIPYYFLSGLNLLSYGVLQTKSRYLLNGLLPSVTPVVTILLLFTWSPSGDWHTLVVALVVGSAIECIVLISVLHRIGQLGFPNLRDMARLRIVIRASLALLPSTVMLAIGPIIDQSIAASMGEGTNAALAYAYKLPAAFQSILLTAIGITALPYFASQLAQNRAAYCLHSLNKLARWILAGGVLLAIPLAIFSAEIVAMLYQRGTFDAAATSWVAPIQLVYFIQLPFVLVAMLGVKVLAALGRNGLMSAYTIAAALLQGGLAYALGMRYGAAGIAWAATLVSVLLAAVYFLTARSTLLNRLSE